MLLNLKDILYSQLGAYGGNGVNHEGQPFISQFQLESPDGCNGFLIRFRAISTDESTVYHNEVSLLAPSFDDDYSLWVLSSNHPGVIARPLTNQKIEQNSATFVFSLNSRDNTEKFREEITIEFRDTQSISYRYAWGTPGGEFKERSAATLIKLPALKNL